MINLIQHLTKFQNISDEEIKEMANGCIEREMLLYLERDFVRSVNERILNTLMTNNNYGNDDLDKLIKS